MGAAHSHSNNARMDCSPSKLVMGEPNIVNTSASGNIAFDLDIQPQSPLIVASPRFKHVTPSTPRTLQEINKKLVEAEERRLLLEKERVERIALNSRLSAANQKKEELEQQVKKAAEVQLNKSQARIAENREKNIEEELAKIKEHNKHVDSVRMHAREGSGDATAIAQKLERAEQLRQIKYEELTNRWKEQDEHMMEVLNRHAQLNQTNEDQLIQQLQDATDRRQLIIQAIKDKQKHHLEEVAKRAAAAKDQQDENQAMNTD